MHVISVLNVTRYATQVNRQHINLVMDAVERAHQDIITLYNITSSLYTSLNYQQVVLHIYSILANLRDSLYYMRQVSMHAMDYIDAATTGLLSPHVLPVEDLRKMLIHIEEALPSTMHLPVLQRIHLTSTDTYAPMFWKQINSFFYSLMHPYRITHSNLKYMKSLI